MTSMDFTINEVPVPASRPKIAKFGKYYPRAHVEYQAKLEKHFKGLPAFRMTGPVEVRMTFVMLRYKASKVRWHRSDLDNLVKIVLDVITKAKDEDGEPKYWDDDSQVVRMILAKRYTVDGEIPHTKVSLREVVEYDGKIEEGSF